MTGRPSCRRKADFMAPPKKSSVRGTAEHERAVTRPSSAAEVDPDRGVELGGHWDANNNYWYADESGRILMWEESTQQWHHVATPEAAIRVKGRIPITDEDRAYMASRDALLKRHYGAPARQFGRVGVMGGPGRIVGKMIAETWSNDYWDLGAVDPTRTGFMNKLSDDFKQAEADIIADYTRRDARAEAETAHAHGDLYQMFVAVASNDKLEKELEGEVAAGTTKKVGSPVRSPARVEGFINDLATLYRDELVKIKDAEPKATASRHGTVAEQRTLAQVPRLAKARGLNFGHIMVNNFIIGVTGPRGGQLSAEMGSPHYGFVIEFKKSPKAMSGRGWQSQGHLIAVDHSLNFPHGGLYVRIFGENYKPGAGVDRRAMGGALDKKPKPPKAPKPRGRLK
jgi:hypothetical protein